MATKKQAHTKAFVSLHLLALHAQNSLNADHETQKTDLAHHATLIETDLLLAETDHRSAKIGLPLTENDHLLAKTDRLLVENDPLLVKPTVNLLTFKTDAQRAHSTKKDSRTPGLQKKKAHGLVKYVTTKTNLAKTSARDHLQRLFELALHAETKTAPVLQHGEALQRNLM